MAASRLVPPLFLVLGFVCPVLGGEIHPPALDDAPRVTRTMTGIHGDPINVGLIGTKDELVAAMLAAKWQPADPITFKSSAKLVRSVLLHRPDETAPVYNLYLWKRKEDLAFEQEVPKQGVFRLGVLHGTRPHTTPLNEQVTLSPLAEVSVGGKSNVPFTGSPCGTADAKSEAISFIWAWAICNWPCVRRSMVYCQEARIRNSVSTPWMACTFGPISTHEALPRERQRLR